MDSKPSEVIKIYELQEAARNLKFIASVMPNWSQGRNYGLNDDATEILANQAFIVVSRGIHELIDFYASRQSATSDEVVEAIELLREPSKGMDYYWLDAQMHDALNLAITALQAYQPWIPCTERMPTEDDADEDGFVLTLDADRQQTDYPHSEIEAWNNRCDVKITHWRPMLPIPKGE